MSNRLSKRLLLFPVTAILGAVAALVIAEVAMRVFRIRPERYPRPTWQVWHQGRFHDSNIWGNGLAKRQSQFADQGVVMGEYVPGAIFKCVYASDSRGYFDDDSGVVMTVDSLGMRSRGVDTSPQKPADVCRILLLGDSFTFGVGVRDGDTFARGVERALNGAGPPRIEVLNAAVQGYNTRDEVLYLEQQWLPLVDPDVVVIVFYVNDAYSDDTILNNGEALGIYIKQPEGMAKTSYVWDMTQHLIKSRLNSRAVEKFYNEQFFTNASQFLDQPKDMWVDWTVSRAALERAAELSKEHGFKLALVIFPELYYLDWRHPFTDIYRLVGDTCGQLEIPVLNLFESTFRGQNPRKLWVHPSDHHPNEKAHAMAAESITAFLVESNLLCEKDLPSPGDSVPQIPQ